MDGAILDTIAESGMRLKPDKLLRDRFGDIIEVSRLLPAHPV